MGRGITISLFLVDGEPSGIICTYLSNWTGQCIKIPRNLLDRADKRAEVSGMGVYFLFGYSDDNPDDKIVYIGEADNVYKRLVQHVRDEAKSFWNEAVVFTSKDDFLTKGHVKYLEHELIRIAKENVNYIVHNRNSATKSSLPEMAVTDMETYLDNVKIIMPTLGYSLFNVEPSMAKEDQAIYCLEQSGIKAKGISTNSGFTVLKGSEISIDIKDSLSNAYKNKREGLISKGIIEKIEDKYIFSKDCEFSSSSTAAAIIVGYSINGRQTWKDKNGITLKQHEEAVLNK